MLGAVSLTFLVRSVVVMEHERVHRREQALAAIRHYQALERAAPQIRARLGELEALPQWQTLYLAKDGVAASQQLSNDLTSLQQAMGLAATTGAPVPLEQQPPNVMGVRLSFVTTVDVLQRFLQAIEQQPHLLRVAALKVKPVSNAGGDSNARLLVTCTVRGHWRVPPGAS